MSKTEAQRLADALEMRGGVSYEVQSEAAALLRRQEVLLKQALEALRELLPDPSDDNHDGYDARDVRSWRATFSAIRNHLDEK